MKETPENLEPLAPTKEAFNSSAKKISIGPLRILAQILARKIIAEDYTSSGKCFYEEDVKAKIGDKVST